MVSKTMRAAVLHGVHDLRVEDVPAPDHPGPGQVQVRINRVGICGSDVHYWEHGRIGNFVVREPLILGHECAGTVAEVGVGVTGLAPGDPVALEPGYPRLSNSISHFYLKRGQYNLCPDIFFFATPPDHGVFCERVNHPADFCFKLPPSVSLDEGAMIEPLSTGIYAARMAPIRMGDTVVITGAGPIGLMNLLAAKAAGASRIVISDTVPARVKLAQTIGATAVAHGSLEELKDRVLEMTGGRGADVCIEAAGHPSALSACIAAARSGAVVMLIGMPPQDVAEVNVNDLIVREIRLQPIFRYNNTFPTGVSLIASHQVDLQPLISRRFTMEEIPAAFEYVAGNRDICVKAIVDLGEGD